MKLFEEDIKDKVKNINLFEVVYKKDNFVLKGNEYPLGYTSYIAIQEECRFIDENLRWIPLIIAWTQSDSILICVCRKN